MKVSNYQKIGKGSLLGSFDVELSLAQGSLDVKIVDVHLFANEKGKWVSFPSKSVKGSDGKAVYTPYISFPKDMEKQIKAEMLKQVLPLLESTTASQEKAELPF